MKIVIVGESQAGKTTFFNALTNTPYINAYLTTISPTYKKINDIVFYDTPGLDKFSYFAKPYIEIADACIILYDVTKINKNDDWKKKILKITRKKIPFLVVGNKVDLIPSIVSDELLVSCKYDNVYKKIEPFLATVSSQPTVSVPLTTYLWCLLPAAEDIRDRCVVS